MTFDKLGHIYFIDEGLLGIQTIDDNGTLRTVAGGGSFASFDRSAVLDGMLANSTPFMATCVAAAPDGSLYALVEGSASSGAHGQVLRIATDGHERVLFHSNGGSRIPFRTTPC
ncbi:MAG: hypothetical protein ACRENE_13555 [Polyangiaceae bacterium]